jgi:hypothetical protein
MIVKCGHRTQRLGVGLLLRPMHTGLGLAGHETHAPRDRVGQS